jgi:hypothetical protein
MIQLTFLLRLVSIGQVVSEKFEMQNIMDDIPQWRQSNDTIYQLDLWAKKLLDEKWLQDIFLGKISGFVWNIQGNILVSLLTCECSFVQKTMYIYIYVIYNMQKMYISNKFILKSYICNGLHIEIKKNTQWSNWHSYWDWFQLVKWFQRSTNLLCVFFRVCDFCTS